MSISIIKYINNLDEDFTNAVSNHKTSLMSISIIKYINNLDEDFTIHIFQYSIEKDFELKVYQKETIYKFKWVLLARINFIFLTAQMDRDLYIPRFND